MKKQLLSIDDFRELKDGDKLELISDKKGTTFATVVSIKDLEIEVNVEGFGNDVFLNVQRIVSKKSKVKEIYLLKDN